MSKLSDITASVAALPISQHKDFSLEANAKGFTLKVPFHPEIHEVLKQPDFVLDKEARVYRIPAAKGPELLQSVTEIDKIQSAREAALNDIIKSEHAYAAAKKAADTKGVVTNPEPRSSGYHQANYVHTGEVIAANRYYVSQQTGIQDGRIQLQRHEAHSLSNQVFVGDKVGIVYDAKGRGEVMPHQQTQELLASRAADKLKANYGKEVDGVTVADQGDKIAIKFDYNPRMGAMVHDAFKDTVNFDKAEKQYLVPNTPEAQAKLPLLVSALRRESVEDRSARKELNDIANARMNDAKVLDAYTDQGQSQTGRILGHNDRYVLQSAGSNYFKLHATNKIDATAEQLDAFQKSGAMVKIRYGEHNKAVVQDTTKGRDQGQSR